MPRALTTDKVAVSASVLPEERTLRRESMDWDRTWVLVADRTRARIVRHATTEGIPAYHRSDLVLRGTGGRHFRRKNPIENCAGARRGGRLSHKVRDQAIRDFADTIVEFLDTHRIAGDFDALVVFAAAPLLQQISGAMPTGLRRVMAAAVPTESPHRLGHDWWRTFKLPRAALH
jgi:hypothetical protein